MNPPTIILDVGGVLYKTRISTLCSADGYFRDLFRRDWHNELDENKNLFIDRDGEVFNIILNFLRDGFSSPLPNDDYTLMCLLQEARYYRLSDLMKLVERKLSYDDLPLKEKNKKPLKTKQRDTLLKKTEKNKKEKKKVTTSSYEGRSLPPIPAETIPVLNDYDQRNSENDCPPMPTRKSAAEKQKRKENADTISLPRNFTHVAHVGWNGSGIIFEQRLANNDNAVHAIIRAAGEADLNPVYNVVNGEDEQYGSNSVEVFLAGPLMKTKETTKVGFYSAPQKRPLPPPKPNLSHPPRPASANK
ncbi:unnamed protein product [Auanema sp. JU1783]|nr:unnamed protein product [Auanema sp. JU1783]